MAGDQHPWRDIYSQTDWQKILASTKPDTSRTTSALTGLTDRIHAYHQIQKDAVGFFEQRRACLRVIGDLALQYIGGLGTNAQLAKTGPGGRKVLTPTGPGGLDPWVMSLTRRAAKKAAYLATLENWINTTKERNKSPVALFMELLKREEQKPKDKDEPLLKLGPYGQMENIDPYHRRIVFWVNVGAAQVHPINNNRMAAAFSTWLQAYFQQVLGGTAAPTFYEWLENHPICTGTPGVTTDYDDLYKDQVRSVNYCPALHTIQVASGGLQIDWLTGGGAVPLQTALFPPSRPGKGSVPGSAAFVWDRTGNLWVHQHVDALFHTSISKGKKIRCAGMINVVQGKVVHLSDDSGHYAPGTNYLCYFVQFLQNKNCLKSLDETWIEYGRSQGGLETITAREFLRRENYSYPNKF
jgi:hypothetical protein